MAASPHTRLMNMFIGLCRGDPNWPSILHDLGYAVHAVEQKMRAGPHTTATPDLVAYSSASSHAVVAECKSGHTIPPSQDAAYRALRTSDLDAWIGAGGAGPAGHTACYVAGGANHSALAGQTILPFIVFGGKDVRGHGRFGDGDLDRALRAGASLRGSREPAGYYPFTHSDGIPVIAQHALYGIVSLVRKLAPGSSLDLHDPDMAVRILEAVHPYHSRLSERHRGDLVRKIRRVVRHIAEDDEFVRQAERLGEQGASHDDARRFISLCQRMADRYEAQHRIDDCEWE